MELRLRALPLPASFEPKLFAGGHSFLQESNLLVGVGWARQPWLRKRSGTSTYDRWKSGELRRSADHGSDFM